MSNLKYKLEALLFSSARSMKIDELCNLTKASPEEIRETINEIKKDYEERNSSIILIDEGDAYRLNVKSEHIDVIQQIVTQTELSKTLMETLAVIAFKYPIKQSDLIKIRTNKAYDHLTELEQIGYIIRQKFGRTKLIKLTPKFFEYFDLPPEKLKEKFESFDGLAKAIKEKEQEIVKIKEDMKRRAEEAGKKGEKEGGPEIDLMDKEGHKAKLEVYEETEKEIEAEEAKTVMPYTDKINNLEVVEVSEKEEKEEEVEEQEETVDMEDVIEEIKKEETGEEAEEVEEEGIEEEVSEEAEAPPIEEDKKKKKERKLEADESEVDRKVEEMLHSKEEEQTYEEEQGSTEESSEEETSEEPDEGKDLLEAEEENESEEKEEKIKKKESEEDEE